MPLIFGKVVSADRGSFTDSATEPAPRPEHVDEQLVRFTVAGIDIGAYVPPQTNMHEGLFQEQTSAGALTCVCDAELLNPREVVAELKANGIVPQSGSTAELIARLIDLKGREGFSLIRGGFSCAVWARNRLWLAVDRFGMKGLRYVVAKNSLLFSSRIEWLGRASHEISLSAIYHYLNLSFVPTHESIYTLVQKLAPGTYLTWDGHESGIGRYWQMAYPEDLDGSADALALQLYDKLYEAVRHNTETANPAVTGCFLSGGTDSSTVLGMSARIWKSAPPSFSIGFTDDEFDELTYSRIAARHFGAQAHECIVQGEDGWRCLPALVRSFDEPFGNPSAIGGYLCAQLAAGSNIELLLAGDGGDELFGGNERYRKDKIYAWIESLPRFTIQNPVWNTLFDATKDISGSARLKNIFFRATLKNPERFYLEDCLTGDLNGHLLEPGFIAAASAIKPLELMKDYYDQVETQSDLNRLLFLDLKFTIADNDLVKVRQTAAACGIRVRYPMLEHSLAEFSGRLPATLKVKGLQKRYLFRKALSKFLPKSILTKTKHGFGVPVSLWFRHHKQFRELLLDVTNDRVTVQRGYFQAGQLSRVVDEHLQGLRDWGQLLWAVLMLELWSREAALAP